MKQSTPAPRARGEDRGVDKVELAVVSLFLYPAACGIFLWNRTQPLAKYDGICGMNIFNSVDTGRKRYLVTYRFSKIQPFWHTSADMSPNVSQLSITNGTQHCLVVLEKQTLCFVRS